MHKHVCRTLCQRKDWTTEQWDKVMWSDESNFTIVPNCGKLYVRRRPGEEFSRECLKPMEEEKHGGGKIMVWAV
jgi:hypothetical protein